MDPIEEERADSMHSESRLGFIIPVYWPSILEFQPEYSYINEYFNHRKDDPVPIPQAFLDREIDTVNKKLCPKIILEGTRLTLKTDIAFALNEHPRIVGARKYRYHSPLISAEWCAFTNFPWGRGLINFEPHEEELALETYRTWARLFELQKYYSWIIDRFHLSTQMYQRIARGKQMDFRWLEERLAPLGFHIVLCTRSPGSFAAAREQRIKISGNPGQYDNLEIFVQEQELIRELAHQSILPVKEIDISDNNIPRAADNIADWLETTGGLYMENTHAANAPH